MAILLATILGIALLLAYDSLQVERRRRTNAESKLKQLIDDDLKFLNDVHADAPNVTQRKFALSIIQRYRSRRGLPPLSQDQADESDAVAASEVKAKTPDVAHQLLEVPLPPPSMMSAEYRQGHALQAKPERQEIDNESLLLYFGAFLFVASAGLFVWLGKAPGIVKCLAVLIVTVVLYQGGIWLYRQRPKLRQAGQAFVGIGVVLAPLVGVSVYNYLLDQRFGYVVWALTSLACLVLYLHAFRIFRSALMAYVLIFTLLSLFESGVGVASLPVYAYGWGLALLAIVLQTVSYLKKWQPELEGPGAQSADIFMPLALLIALATAPQLGMAQFGISLLLAAAYYGLRFLTAQGSARASYALVSQLAAILGVPLLVVGLSDGGRAGLVASILIVLLQLACLAIRRNVHSPLWRQYSYVLMTTVTVTTVLSLDNPAIALAAGLAGVVTGAVIWLKQRIAAAYTLAGLSLVALPFIYGQLLRVDTTAELQTSLGLVSLVLLFLAQFSLHRKVISTVPQWNGYSSVAIGVAIAAVMLSSIFATPLFCLLVGLAVSLLLTALAEHEKSQDWAEAVSIVMLVPVLRSIDDGLMFLLSIVAALTFISLLTLRFRSEILRWSSTLGWLALPLALGRSELFGVWSSEAYAWAYAGVMIVLLGLRAIARGIVLRSDKVRVISLMRSASFSYVCGYIAAALLAILISLGSDDSRLHTSLILLLMVVTTWVAGLRVERRPQIAALQPFLAQALLLSALRPESGNNLMMLYLLASSALAVAVYFVVSAKQPSAQEIASQSVALSAIIAGLTASAAVIFIPSSWPMAVGLMAFGAMLLDYSRERTQAERECSVAVVAAGLAWLLVIAGVREVQVYSHIGVALFAGFAYWRHVRGEREQSDQYLWAVLLTATVPLALEALSSTSNGGLYGWWLLLEQIAIMLLGMAIKRSFVTRWGLYVAVAAVLYQLRGLGYAALAVLAIFLIGLAVYRLQKTDRK